MRIVFTKVVRVHGKAWRLEAGFADLPKGYITDYGGKVTYRSSFFELAKVREPQFKGREGRVVIYRELNGGAFDSPWPVKGLADACVAGPDDRVYLVRSDGSHWEVTELDFEHEAFPWGTPVPGIPNPDTEPEAFYRFMEPYGRPLSMDRALLKGLFNDMWWVTSVKIDSDGTDLRLSVGRGVWEPSLEFSYSLAQKTWKRTQ